jgi:hypothetical protein
MPVSFSWMVFPYFSKNSRVIRSQISLWCGNRRRNVRSNSSIASCSRYINTPSITTTTGSRSANDESFSSSESVEKSIAMRCSSFCASEAGSRSSLYAITCGSSSSTHAPPLSRKARVSNPAPIMITRSFGFANSSWRRKSSIMRCRATLEVFGLVSSLKVSRIFRPSWSMKTFA